MVENTDIEGVFVKQPQPMLDDRGYFMELIKHPFMADFTIKQSSIALTHPGVIKAFHWHKHQTDIWFGLSGNARCVLYDVRGISPTYKKFMTIYMGEPEQKLLFIPAGVAHGYQVLGNKPFKLLYFTNQAYDPSNPDEGRIAFDSVGYDWGVKNR